jgi:hypothetical protein
MKGCERMSQYAPSFWKSDRGKADFWESASSIQNDDVMGNILREDVILCTDAATNYKAFAKEHKINHEVINIRKDGYVKKGFTISNMWIIIMVT